MPAGVVEGTASVQVDVPEPGAEINLGLKVVITPLGWPVAHKSTEESKPPVMAVVMVEVPVSPGSTETRLGEALMVKPGAAVTARLKVVDRVRPPPVPMTVRA